MSEGDLVEALGTIARSGTRSFVERLGEAGAGGAANLIGQFGVGFYSAFMVASKVEVFSQRAGTGNAHVWSSDGLGTFSVSPAEADGRGTRIVMHLRDTAKDYLEAWKIESVIRSYSDHVAHPILLTADGETRQINSANAIWTRPKAEVTAEQHKEFFAHLAHGAGEPALTIHYRAEGRHDYTVLLYVPGERPFDLYDPERRGHQKLYVKRVYIADDVTLLPPYLRFVRGVIDSSDMPLNLSREMLQNNPEVAAIRKAVTNKVLGELKRFAQADAEGFARVWEVFGPVIKEGLYEDAERREQLYEFARFRSLMAESLTLKDYAGSLKENQTAIYYITGEDAQRIKASPQLEGYRARGIDVLLLTDPVDSFWVRVAMEFDGKPFRSVAQGTADLDLIPLDDGAKGKPAADADLAPLITAMTTALGDKVQAVRVSKRLAESAVCLVNEGGLDRTLEKLLSRQRDAGVSVSVPVLEINGGHPLISALARRARDEPGDPLLGDAALLLLDQAHALEGEVLTDPAGFGQRMSRIMAKVFT
jgi:molecular chaperone HtpG